MLSPDHRVSYTSSIGQHVSVNLLVIIRSIRAKVTQKFNKLLSCQQLQQTEIVVSILSSADT